MTTAAFNGLVGAGAAFPTTTTTVAGAMVLAAVLMIHRLIVVVLEVGLAGLTGMVASLGMI